MSCRWVLCPEVVVCVLALVFVSEDRIERNREQRNLISRKCTSHQSQSSNTNRYIVSSSLHAQSAHSKYLGKLALQLLQILAVTRQLHIVATVLHQVRAEPPQQRWIRVRPDNVQMWIEDLALVVIPRLCKHCM